MSDEGQVCPECADEWSLQLAVSDLLVAVSAKFRDANGIELKVGGTQREFC